MKISPDYLALNERYHQEEPEWGASAGRFRSADIVALANQICAKSILDYGCGKGTLKQQSGLDMDEYDPAIPGKDCILQGHYEMVVCVDVMEHVEPECVDSVLEEINSLTLRCAYFVIYLTPAIHTLPDGSNCHRTIETPDWWLSKIKRIFNCSVTHSSTKTELKVVVQR